MLAWMVVVMGLAAFSSPGAGVAQTPTALRAGVTFTPARGWESAQDVWDVGPGAVSLQRAGALVAFDAESYGGTTQDLLDQQVADLKSQFNSFRSLPVAQTTIAGGTPGLRVLFSGTADSGQLEGELVVGTEGGIGVVMLAVASPGQLARVQSDLDGMLRSLDLPS